MQAIIFGPKRHAAIVDGELVDLTQAGLGGSAAQPPTMQGSSPGGKQLWSVAAVEREVALVVARQHDPDALRPRAPWDIGQTMPFPALRCYLVKTPEMRDLLPAAIGARPGTRYVEASGAGSFFGRTLVALDQGGDRVDWQNWPWLDKATGDSATVTTRLDDPDLGAVVLETLDERAARYSDPPRGEPIGAVIVDRDRIAHVGRVSGVLDADEDGLGNLRIRRPVHREADRLPAVQNDARRLGKREFARLTGLPATVAERAAKGQPISARNVATALAALRTAKSDRVCELPGCDAVLGRGARRFCSLLHAKRVRDRSYRARKADRLAAADQPDDDACPECGCVLLGTSASGPCPVCHPDDRRTP